MSNTAARPLDSVDTSWVDRAPVEAQPYLRLARLDRPIGTWLLFWPCVFGLVLGAVADGRAFTSRHDIWLLLLFGIGAIVMRGAGCTFNDIVDHDIDAKVVRTRDRPIPSGAVSVKQALAFLAALCAIGLVILLQLNWLAVELGIASLALVAIYPFMKRVTWWPQAWLGLTFNWGAVMGYAAESGRIDATVIVLYAGCFFWTLGYDTIYALQDIDDDALAGVKSTARLFGREAKRFIVMFYAASFALLATAGLAAHLGPLFLILLLPTGVHLVWQARELDIASAASALRLFRANRNAGALAAAAFFVAGWLQ